MNTVAANNDMDQWLNQKLDELLPIQNSGNRGQQNTVNGHYRD